MYRIKEILKEKGISVSELAEMIGQQQSHLSRFLGKEESPTLKTLKAIADSLNVEISDLFEKTNPSEAFQIAERMERDLAELKKLL